MEYKEKVKYLDIVIKNIEKTEMFDIDSILSNKTNLSNNEIENIELDLISFGNSKKHNLFELINPENTSTRWLKLTTKGEKLKQFKKGFVKFEKSLTKKPLTLYQKIYLPILIISVLGNFLFSYLAIDYNSKNNTLIEEKSNLKDTINKLKLKIESYKVSSLNDTL
jgi:hypothetical protein